MHARVSTFQGPPNLSDEDVAQATKLAREKIVPAARQMGGFQGVIYLTDRETGKSISVTLWETRESLRASEEAANRLRKEGADAGGEEIRSVERFEVAFWDVSEGVGPIRG